MVTTDNHDPGSERPSPQPLDHPARREALASIVRAGSVIIGASACYALAPLGNRVDPGVALQLAGWLLAIAALIGWQLRAVIRASYPGLRAVEAVAVSVPILILLFAATYFATARANPASFTEPLTRIDALYVTVTIFATVGFGDISPRTQEARILVTGQMLADLVLIGFVAKVFFGAVKRRSQTLLETRPPGTLRPTTVSERGPLGSMPRSPPAGGDVPPPGPPQPGPGGLEPGPDGFAGRGRA